MAKFLKIKNNIDLYNQYKILSADSIGIGTNSPQTELHLKGDGKIRLEQSGTGIYWDLNTTGNELAIQRNLDTEFKFVGGGLFEINKDARIRLREVPGSNEYVDLNYAPKLLSIENNYYGDRYILEGSTFKYNKNGMDYYQIIARDSLEGGLYIKSRDNYISSGGLTIDIGTESDHFHIPDLLNELAYLYHKDSSKVLLNTNSAYGNLKYAFEPGSNFFYAIMDASDGTERYVVIEIDLPRSLNYSQYYGIIFGNSWWTPDYLKIEAYDSVDNTWYVVGEWDNISRKQTIFKKYFTRSSNGITKVRYILKVYPNNNKTIRITNLFVYNYNSQSLQYTVKKFDDEVYNLTLRGSTYIDDGLIAYKDWNGGDGNVELHGDRPSLKFVYDNSAGDGKNEISFLGTGIAGGIRIIKRSQGSDWQGIAIIYENGDIELEQQGKGLILKGDDGNRYRVKIDNNGQLVAVRL